MFNNYQLVEYMEKVHAAGWRYWYGTVGYKCTTDLYNHKKKQYPSHYGSARTSGWRYWYGTVGYKCTTDLYNRKKKQYPSHYGSARTSGYKKDIADGAMCADCVGVIKSFFWTGGVFGGSSKYQSNNCPDTSANGMIKLCKKSGAIGTIPDIPGLVVWRDGHIGVYVGNGYTIELRGYAYDCQKRKLSAGTWTRWGQLPENMLTYLSEDATDPVDQLDLGDRILRKGMTGEDVRSLQNALISLGYALPKYGADGDYGNETRDAVIVFQRDHDLEDDGEFGPKSFKALTLALAEEDADEAGEGSPDNGGDNAKTVLISGGNCYVRNLPDKVEGAKLGVVHAGDRLVYASETAANGWHKVRYKDALGWVSGVYGRVEE